MCKSKKYRVNVKDFKKLEKLVEWIYNMVVVLDYFCATQQEIEELYNLTPIIKNLRTEADFLNAFFIDAEGVKN